MRLIPRRFAWALALALLANASPARADTVDDQFAAAAAHYRQQHWQQACDAWDRLLAAHPDHRRANQARFFYGEALSQLERWPQAQAQFAELIRRDPDHRYARQALFRSGETAYLGGELKTAERELAAFRARYPQDELNGYALPYLASLALRAEHAVAAELLFIAALEQFPAGPLVDDCHLGLGRALEPEGRLVPAQVEYKIVADANSPLADQALLRSGTIDNMRGEHGAALATLERLVRTFPNSPCLADAQLGRGYALVKLGRWADAEAVLQTVLDKPGSAVEAHYWLGLSQRSRGDWHAAATTLLAGGRLEEAHRLTPAIGFHAADSLARDKQYAEATEAYDRVLARWPDNGWADDCQLGKLRIAAEQQAYERCVQLADEMAARYADSPLLPQAELAKGQALSVLGKYAAAIEPLTRVLQKPRSAESPPAEEGVDRSLALSTLALCQARLGHFAEARQNLAELRVEKAHAELIADTSYQIAELAFAANEFPLARELFSELAQGDRPSATHAGSLAGLAWCQSKANEWDAAAKTCDQLLRQYPDSPLAPDAALLDGRALEHLERRDAALAMYRVVIDRYATSPRAAEALWSAARLHDSLEQTSQASELYGTLIEKHADFAELDAALYRRAWLLSQAQQPQQANELFARLRRDFPQSRFAADATLRLAESAVATEHYDEADRLLAEITTPQTSAATRQHALYLQGRSAMGAGHWTAAATPLEQLIADYPDGELALAAAYVMAEASYHEGKFEQAAQRLADLAEKTKDHPEPWSATAELRHAQALAQMKEWSQALDVARSIASRFPQFEQQHEVDYLIGRSLAAEADLAGAREAYARVLESPRGKTTQTAGMAQWMIGESYFHQENYTAALAEYAKVDERYPFPRWQAAALLQAGKCREALSQWREAVETYERLLKNDPMGEFSAEAASRSAAAQARVASGSQKLK
jgi:TolA-binding protein